MSQGGQVGAVAFLTRETSRADLARVLEALPIGVVRLNLKRVVVALNPAAAALMAVEPDAARGHPVDDLFRLDAADASGRARVITTLHRHDGVVLTVGATWLPSTSGDAWMLLEDVTEWEALRQERKWMAFHDPITGLINQRGFEGRLQQVLAEAHEAQQAYVFGHVEIDDVEAVRETFGPLAGDELIRQVAHTLRGVLRRGDRLARLDAVRFGVLVRDEQAEGPDGWTARLKRAVSRFRFNWQNEQFTLGATVGLVAVPWAQEADVRGIVAAAEAAAASTRGRGSGRRSGSLAGSRNATNSATNGATNSATNSDVSARYEDLRWLSRLHRALKKGQFELVRQAIVPTDHPAGAPVPMYELLLRVVDAGGRLQAPTPFIHAAEKFHLIGSVDRWVVREALVRLAALPADETYAITVNVSGKSVSEAQFLDDVLAIFAHTAAPAKRVYFELTETAAVGNLRRARRFVSTLRQLGCRFILDDFGSGLSSFAYLEDLDVDFLKIDGRFVLGMATDPIPRAIVTAVHRVAEAMGIVTIAECVEDQAARQAVAALGVDYVQGFGIHRPEVWRVPEPR